MIAKTECNHLGTNLRFVVTNRPGAPTLPGVCYDNHVQRGESENRNKELNNCLAGDRLIRILIEDCPFEALSVSGTQLRAG